MTDRDDLTLLELSESEWQLFVELAPILQRMAHSIASRDKRLARDEETDLVGAFLFEKMPKLVQLTRQFEDERRRRYIVLSFRNFLRSRARNGARQRAALERFAREARQDYVSADSSIETMENLEGALREIPEKLSKAASMFLGVGGSPASILEISRVLGTSRYAAEKATLDGILALAIRLGKNGVLSAREVTVCQLVLLKGVGIRAAAKELRLTTHQVRAALERARSIVSGALRRG